MGLHVFHGDPHTMVWWLVAKIHTIPPWILMVVLGAPWPHGRTIYDPAQYFREYLQIYTFLTIFLAILRLLVDVHIRHRRIVRVQATSAISAISVRLSNPCYAPVIPLPWKLGINGNLHTMGWSQS